MFISDRGSGEHRARVGGSEQGYRHISAEKKKNNNPWLNDKSL